MKYFGAGYTTIGRIAQAGLFRDWIHQQGRGGAHDLHAGIMVVDAGWGFLCLFVVVRLMYITPGFPHGVILVLLLFAGVAGIFLKAGGL